jgi:hypothetical protein
MFERDLLFRELETIGFDTIGRFETPYRDYFLSASLNNDPNVVIEEAAVRPFNQQDRTFLYTKLLSEALNIKATKANTAKLDKSNKLFGIDSAVLIARLQKYVDFTAIEQSLIQKLPTLKIDKTKILNEIITEAVHQFQAKIYIDSTEWDGIIGPSTLSSLGFVFHNNKRFTSKMAKPLIKKLFVSLDKEIKEYNKNLPIALPDINGSNWFDFIINPCIFGKRGTKGYGFHLFLILLLREVENYLCTKLAAELTQLFDTNITSTHGFKGKPYGQVPRLIGMALNIRENHGDIRTESDNTPLSRHLSGIAIDIDYTYNPWVRGATGLNILQEAQKFKNKKLNTKATTAQVYFAELAEANSTADVYDTLKSNSNDCIPYLKFKKTKPIKWGSSTRSQNEGFLNLRKELVVALRDRAGLAWGAVDLGKGNMGNGDMMHFDMRTSRIGQAYSKAIDQDSVNDYLAKVHRYFSKF